MRYIKPPVYTVAGVHWGPCLPLDNLLKDYEKYLMDGLRICFDNRFNSVKSL